MIINNNLNALSAINSTNSTNSTRAADTTTKKSIQPQADGLKVKSPADDASGLEKMRSLIKGYDMAIKHAQDGISMLRIAEGALSDTSGLLQRMRELTLKAGNDSLSMQDRQ